MADLDIDPELETRLRETFASIAATSHLANDNLQPDSARRRWPMVAAAVLIVGGLAATGLVVRRADESVPMSAIPGPYATVVAQLPDDFEHVAVLESTDENVTFEAVDVDTPRLLTFMVSRQPIPPDPGGSITLAELDADVIDPDQDLNVSLPDGRQIGIRCQILAPGQMLPCSSIDRPVAPQDLRSFARRLARFPLEQLPPADATEPTIDRMSIAVSAAFETAGLEATGGGVDATNCMTVRIGRPGVGQPGPENGDMQIRAVANYVPTIGSSDATPRNLTVGDVTLTWTAMPDGSVWTIASRFPIDPPDHESLLENIEAQLTGPSVPSYPVLSSTTPDATASPPDPTSPTPTATTVTKHATLSTCH